MSLVQLYLLRKQITLIQHPNIFMTQHDIDESELNKDGNIVPYNVVRKPDIIDEKQNKSQPVEEIIQPLQSQNQTKKLSRTQKQIILIISLQQEAEFIQIDLEPSQVETKIQQILNKKTQEEYLHLKKLTKAQNHQAI
ncbi:unnamed protein product [Paramecium sonneborni]|uniref:Uncharacterized protein n=1 Tax=Paramecium sonneborni TaxID=65129 RepID=A0A8S1PBD8_9CILI|nr:unnamed protein product [Paramecium sonneborni]